MEIILAVACDRARTSPEGKLDLGGVFNELNAPGFPAGQERMTLVFVLEWDRGDSGRKQFRADMVDDAERKVFTIQGHTDVDARPEGRPPAQTQLILPVKNVVFPHPGRYRFHLHVGGETRKILPLYVMEQAADESAD